MGRGATKQNLFCKYFLALYTTIPIGNCYILVVHPGVYNVTCKLVWGGRVKVGNLFICANQVSGIYFD